MPRLVKGGRWTYGWVVVGPTRDLPIPPEAWRAYGLQAGTEAIFVPGSRASGGFGVTTPALLAGVRLGAGDAKLRELGRGRFDPGQVTLPASVGLAPGARLLAVRGSGRALAFVAHGPIWEQAERHPELPVFRLEGGPESCGFPGGLTASLLLLLSAYLIVQLSSTRS